MLCVVLSLRGQSFAASQKVSCSFSPHTSSAPSLSAPDPFFCEAEKWVGQKQTTSLSAEIVVFAAPSLLVAAPKGQNLLREAGKFLFPPEGKEGWCFAEKLCPLGSNIWPPPFGGATKFIFAVRKIYDLYSKTSISSSGR